MNTNSLLFDPNSRYNNLDNTNVVFLTPKQVLSLDVGFDPSQWEESEQNKLFPFLVDALKEMIKETTIGDTNGSEIQIPVQDSNSRIFICIQINGKLCKLQSEEYDVFNGYSGIPLEKQMKVFQRLIKEGQITLDDLAEDDINNDVYKRLVINDMGGTEVYQQKCSQVDEWVKSQSQDPKYKSMKSKLMKIINN